LWENETVYPGSCLGITEDFIKLTNFVVFDSMEDCAWELVYRHVGMKDLKAIEYKTGRGQGFRSLN
jgi:hypothetical protein